MTDAEDRAERDIGRLAAALGDPTRRQVFFAVRASGSRPVQGRGGPDRRHRPAPRGLPPRQARLLRLPRGRLPPRPRPLRPGRRPSRQALPPGRRGGPDGAARAPLRPARHPAAARLARARRGRRRSRRSSAWATTSASRSGRRRSRPARAAPGVLAHRRDGRDGAPALALRLRRPRRGRGQPAGVRVPLRGGRLRRPGAHLRPRPRDLARACSRRSRPEAKLSVATTRAGGDDACVATVSAEDAG